MNGRHIDWHNHALIDVSGEDSISHLASVIRSPAIEVALTKVVEGGVARYYSQFKQVVAGILKKEPGCDGFFISPLIENPQNQLLLVNWRSVDVGITKTTVSRFMLTRRSGPPRNLREEARFYGVY